jgi:hypothetical protein
LASSEQGHNQNPTLRMMYDIRLARAASSRFMGMSIRRCIAASMRLITIAPTISYLGIYSPDRQNHVGALVHRAGAPVI